MSVKGRSKYTSQTYRIPVPSSALLARIAERHVHNEKTPAVDRHYTGKPNRGHPKPKLTDAEVIEMRHRHEHECWTIDRCATHYGLRRDHCARILDYSVRSNVTA